MKKILLICGLMALKQAGSAGAAVVLDQNWTVGGAIPEGNPVGMATSQTLSGLSDGAITDVAVRLNLSGGYNGGLYGYLVLQDAQGRTATEILLNEVGTSPANPFGSAGSGFNVTLSDSGSANGSIHNAAGNPTGLWQPDSGATLDGTFGGMTANGTWTLFLADKFDGGGVTTLDSWGLTISATAVPEPSVTGLACGMAALFAFGGMRLRRKSLSPAGSRLV